MRLWIFLALLAGCGDGFSAAQKADTIESYEAYLEANPEGAYALQATSRLEDLMLIKAKEEKSLEAYNAYLERFPDGSLKERCLEERETFLFDWAAQENTTASWQKYLEEYPRGKKKNKQKARRMLKVHAYLSHIALGEAVKKQVNLAENPEGPLDGWGFELPVTNNGPSTVTDLRLTIEFLVDGGGVIERKEWPVVAPSWPIPIEEEHKVPMAPGDERLWTWSTGGLPESWNGEFRFNVSKIELLED